MTVPRSVLVVVDDEQAILNIVRRFAGRAGFEVVTCSSRPVERLDLSSTITRRAPPSSGMARGWFSSLEA
jgi:hypothetical protein